MAKHRREARRIRFVFLFSLPVAAACVFAAALPAYAAPLTFTSATPLVLTSPSTTLTVAAGSVADSLTVNATSVVVDLSASTGGSFTLLSPDYHLDVATSTTGGTVTYTCVTTGTSTIVLAQSTGSTIYTVTPTSTSCPVTSSSGSTSGTTVNVGNGYPSPSFTINGGAASTASQEVTLSISAPPNVSSFSITTSHDGAGETATSSYASALSLDLCAANLSSCTEGTYLVSIDFLDASGASIGTASQSIGYTGGGTATASNTTPTSSTTTTSTSSPSSTPTATSSLPTTTGSAMIATSTTATTSIAQLESLLAELQTELQALLKEAAAKGIVVQGISASSTSPSSSSQSPSPYSFTRNLSLWDRGADVNALQRYLVTENKGPAAQALSRHGTTNTFGPLTFAALTEFQKAVGIVPDSGYFGPITRGYIKAHGE